MKYIFTHEFPFERMWYGGGNQITRGLALQLARQGHEVHVVSTGHDEMEVTTADLPVKYHLSGYYNKRLFGLQIAYKTLQLVRELCPDVVCSMTSEAAIVLPFCNFIRVPTVFFLAAPETPDFRLHGLATLRTIRYKVGIFFQSIGARYAKKVVSLSDFISQQAHQNWRIPCQKLATIGTGLDDVFLSPLAMNQRTIGAKGPSFISVGRLTLPQKPIHLMAEVLAILSASWQSWTIVGSGIDEPKLRAQVTKLGIADKTAFLGTQEPAKVAALLDEHDIVLLPSNYESFFLTVYEAAARGKIVITNDVADIRNYFACSPAVIVAESVTPEAYRKSIVYTIETFDYLQSTAIETANRVKHDYNWAAVAERFLQALR